MTCPKMASSDQHCGCDPGDPTLGGFALQVCIITATVRIFLRTVGLISPLALITEDGELQIDRLTVEQDYAE